ncbi:uncharacterized protein [Malus domestica]|uniref:uncharacterized protein n=1 Tax=Malus domestica TaxID=3750 RepID=UPI003975F5AF
MIDVCNHDSYFVQKKDAFGVMSLFPKQKITAALRMLVYRASADQVDEIARMGKSIILESLMRFCGAIESIYTAEYLRRPTEMELQRLLKKGEMRGFPGMIESIDCIVWYAYGTGRNGMGWDGTGRDGMEQRGSKDALRWKQGGRRRRMRGYNFVFHDVERVVPGG